MKEGAALGIWMIYTRFEVYVCSYVELSSMKVDQFFSKMTTKNFSIFLFSFFNNFSIFNIFQNFLKSMSLTWTGWNEK